MTLHGDSAGLPRPEQSAQGAGGRPLGVSVAVAMVVASAGLILLWVGVLTGTGLAAFDPTITAAIVAGRPGWLAAVGVVVSDAGSPGVMITAVVLASAFAARRAHRWVPLAAGAGGLAMLSVADVGVKDLVARVRPPTSGWAMSTSGYSFPSGHAVYSAGALIVVVMLLHFSAPAERGWRGWPVRAACTAAGLLVVAAIGVSRLVVGVHYPSDVLAGWAIAVIVIAPIVLVVRHQVTTLGRVDNDRAPGRT